MRDLILKMSMSLDGFASDLAGRNAWMFGGDAAAKAWSAQRVAEAGLHVMGSRTFRAMASHWPTATDVFAAPMNAVPKAVFSRRGAAVLEGVAPGTGDWADAYVAGGDLTDEIAALKAQGGAPIMAHGGVAFARSLIAARLVDRFVLMVVPVAIGQGLPVFADLAEPLALTLVESRAFPGGAVAQTYRRG